MNKEIFISYTSTDRALATTILRLLEQNGFACWMAPRDIPPGEDYSSAIPAAIKVSMVVVVLCSQAAYESPNVKAELRLAFDNKVRIIPFKIEDLLPPDSWQYFLAFSQWIDAADDPKLHIDEVLKAVRHYDSVPKPVKAYKVGDYFDDGQKQGVVFEVSEDGHHGKIVSLVQSNQQWCSVAEFYEGIKTGATDQANGMTNQRKIEQIDNWRNKYPAFAWCADLGEGWYLPAVEELEKILLDVIVHDKVNRTLQKMWAPELFARGDKVWYLSSTEYNELCAWYVGMGNGLALFNLKNVGNYYVRAVSAF